MTDGNGPPGAGADPLVVFLDALLWGALLTFGLAVLLVGFG